MSTIRVLVGTRKGAFILTSDAKRQKWEIAGPLFGGWEHLSHERIARQFESHLCLANQRVVRPGHATLERRRRDMGNGRQQVRV